MRGRLAPALVPGGRRKHRGKTYFGILGLMTLSASCSIGKGSAFIVTRTRYSLSSFDGTRHEYPQVKPQPYSKLPCWTTSPLESVMVNSGFEGRAPSTIMLSQISPAEPTRRIVRYNSFLFLT